MTEGTSMATHLNEFNTIVNQLSSVQSNFDDKVCALYSWRLYQIIGYQCGLWLVILLVVQNLILVMSEIEYL